MANNRFEQVDDVQPDAITLWLKKSDDRALATVTCPAAVSAKRLATDTTSEELPAQDAFRSAIRLANEVKAPIVVMDPDGLWQAEWGTLYRAED
jgi:hypothetical protein